MSITTDRDIFIGGHLTFETKERFRQEAQKRDKPMSELLSDLIEEFLLVVDDGPAPSKFSDQDVPLPFEEPDASNDDNVQRPQN